MPRRRVKDFVGREKQLEDIKARFDATRSEGPLVLILHALGGQGKSQLALEFCRQARESRVYRGIFWIQANGPVMAAKSFEEMAVVLGLKSSAEILEERIVCYKVKQELCTWTERWLMVFDNYDSSTTFQTLPDYFPQGEPSRNGYRNH